MGRPSLGGLPARVERSRETAALLGLAAGDIHPDTGRVWTGDRFETPEAYSRRLRRRMINNAKRRALEHGREFALTVKDIDDMWPPTGRCPVFPDVLLEHGGGHSPSSASLDRLNSSMGYTRENCRIISWRANRLKNDATAAELQQILSYMQANGAA